MLQIKVNDAYQRAIHQIQDAQPIKPSSTAVIYAAIDDLLLKSLLIPIEKAAPTPAHAEATP